MKKTNDPLLKGKIKNEQQVLQKKIIRYYTFITDNY